jgi:hypothetical protein
MCSCSGARRSGLTRGHALGEFSEMQGSVGQARGRVVEVGGRTGGGRRWGSRCGALMVGDEEPGQRPGRARGKPKEGRADGFVA